MRRSARIASSLLLIASMPTAMAGSAAGDASAAPDDRPAGRLSSRECGLSTPYNVQVDGGGIWLYRSEGAPREIFFHDGVLSVDQQVQAVSPADARRLRRMEDGARALMPQVAGIARDSVAIVYDALADMTRVMTASERRARKVERRRERALAHVDGSLGNGRWDQDVFDRKFQAEVGDVVEDVTRSLVRSALWAALTGRADRMEARADRVDREVDRKIDARGAALEARAHALCPQVASLRALQDALDYRYRGKPLVMLQATASPAVAAGAEDHPRDGSIRIATHK